MAPRDMMKRPGVQIKIGLAFLILASLSKLFVSAPRVAISDNWSDGVTGLLYGMSIGFMLLGIWRRSRQRRSEK